jgi:hypothetical protein
MPRDKLYGTMTRIFTRFAHFVQPGKGPHGTGKVDGTLFGQLIEAH